MKTNSKLPSAYLLSDSQKSNNNILSLPNTPSNNIPSLPISPSNNISSLPNTPSNNISSLPNTSNNIPSLPNTPLPSYHRHSDSISSSTTILKTSLRRLSGISSELLKCEILSPKNNILNKNIRLSFSNIEDKLVYEKERELNYEKVKENDLIIDNINKNIININVLDDNNIEIENNSLLSPTSLFKQSLISKLNNIKLSNSITNIEYNEFKSMIYLLEDELETKTKNLRMAAEIGQVLIERNENLELEVNNKNIEIDELRNNNTYLTETLESERRQLEARIKRRDSSIKQLEDEIKEARLELKSNADIESQHHIEIEKLKRRLQSLSNELAEQQSLNSPSKHHHGRNFSELLYLYPEDKPEPSISKKLPNNAPINDINKSKLIDYKLTLSQSSSNKIKKRLFVSSLPMFRCKKSNNGVFKLNKLDVIDKINRPFETLSDIFPSNKLKVDFGVNVFLKSNCSFSKIDHLTIAPVEIKNNEPSLVENLEREYISLTAILQSTRNELEELKSSHKDKVTESFAPVVSRSKSYGTVKQSFGSLLDDIEEDGETLFAFISVDKTLYPPYIPKDVKSPTKSLVKSPTLSPALRSVMSPFNDKSDAHLEYFFLTVLAMKQNSTHMDKLHFINPLDLWTRAYHTWVECELSRMYWDSVTPDIDISNLLTGIQKLKSLINYRNGELEVLRNRLKDSISKLTPLPKVEVKEEPPSIFTSLLSYF